MFVISFKVNIVIEHVNAKKMTIVGAPLHWTEANGYNWSKPASDNPPFMRPVRVYRFPTPGLGQITQQQQNFLDDQTIIWMIAWTWYCHWWVEGGGCSSSVLWNNIKAKQQQYIKQAQTK